MAHGDDLIGQQPELIVGMMLALVKTPNGPAFNVQFQGDFNEFHARFMLDKARAFFDDYWRVQNAPKVAPVNGLPEALRKHLRG